LRTTRLRTHVASDDRDPRTVVLHIEYPQQRLTMPRAVSLDLDREHIASSDALHRIEHQVRSLRCIAQVLARRFTRERQRLCRVVDATTQKGEGCEREQAVHLGHSTVSVRQRLR